MGSFLRGIPFFFIILCFFSCFNAPSQYLYVASENVDSNTDENKDVGHQVIYAEAIILQSTLYWKWLKEYESAYDMVVDYNKKSDAVHTRSEECKDQLMKQGGKNGIASGDRSTKSIVKSYIVESVKSSYQNWFGSRNRGNRVEQIQQQQQQRQQQQPGNSIEASNISKSSPTITVTTGDDYIDNNRANSATESTTTATTTTTTITTNNNNYNEDNHINNLQQEESILPSANTDENIWTPDSDFTEKGTRFLRNNLK